MSQFCGSFWALSRRSRLTVSLYCACGCDVESVVSETPARMAQEKRTRVRVLRGIRFFSLRGASCPGRAMALIAMDNCICERLGRQWEVASQPVRHGYCAVAGRLVIPIDAYLPAAFRSAALIRPCQPGPSSWK